MYEIRSIGVFRIGFSCVDTCREAWMRAALFGRSGSFAAAIHISPGVYM